MKRITKLLLLSIFCTLLFVQPVSAAKVSSRPVIRKVTTTQTTAKIYWKKAKNCKRYYIYRKVRGGKYKKIASVNKYTTSYTDKKIRHGKVYYYKIKSKTSKKSYTSSEKAVKLVRMNAPNITGDFTNYHAVLRWDRVSKADGYIVYRKYGHNGSYQRIATVKGGSRTSYEDIYHSSLNSKEREALLLSDVYLDPTINGFIYTVKPYRKMKYGTAYGECLQGGAFHMDPPVIVNVTKTSDTRADVEWGTITNAQCYSIFSGYKNEQGKIQWKKNATVDAANTLRQSVSVEIKPEDTYFTVMAEATKNGSQVSSSIDEGFHIDRFCEAEYEKKNILYLGDSIAMGRPYIRTAEEKEVFSFPWRVKQLTGIHYDNPSVRGATYTSGNGDQCHIVTEIAEKIYDGTLNGKTYKDYDVIVLSAGTNDYSKNVELGALDCDSEYQFYGALNKIMDWIQEGNEERIAEGKAPVKVIFMDLFYAQRAYQGGRFADRYTYPNARGLTLTAYQNALNHIYEKYLDQGMDVFRFYTGSIVNANNCAYVTSDNLHMTRFTYAQIGNQLAEFVMKVLSEEEEQEQEPIESISEESESVQESVEMEETQKEEEQEGDNYE